ncbi:MAG TPA: ATP-binding protein [Tepidiformaceae bacterium]|nr:ATP-binding protein [Tepidiformaceae bacterium]
MQRVAQQPAVERVQGLIRWVTAPEISDHQRGYLVGALAVALVVAIRAVLQVTLEDLAPTFIVFMGAVILVALFAGTGPALMATVALLVVGEWLFVPPALEPRIGGEDLVVGAAFLFEGAVIAVLGGRLRAAVTRLVASETAAQERESDARRANEALRVLADAGVELNASLDLDSTLTSVAGLVVPRFADGCTIDLVEGEALRRVATAYAREEIGTAIAALDALARDRKGTSEAARAAIASSGGVYLREIGEEFLREFQAGDGNAVAALRQVRPRSLVVAPMIARDQVLGVMSFLRVGDSAPFGDDDYELALQLARRTAISADNARLYTAARKANDAKDEFLGLMSHELRTPITVIHGGARVLRSRGQAIDRETADGILRDVERESERLSRMLENLLALSRAELDHEVAIEPVLLQRLLPAMLPGLVPGQGREVTLAVEGEPEAVAGEPGYIEHILRNLVGNAVKYSPPGAPIEIVIRACPGGAEVAVLDRGFGVPPGEADRIFERFYRSDRTARLASGAGLGLAVCKRLVEAMSGQVWARPRDGGGLEVGFSLPPYNEEGLDA